MKRTLLYSSASKTGEGRGQLRSLKLSLTTNFEFTHASWGLVVITTRLGSDGQHPSRKQGECNLRIHLYTFCDAFNMYLPLFYLNYRAFSRYDSNTNCTTGTGTQVVEWSICNASNRRLDLSWVKMSTSIGCFVCIFGVLYRRARDCIRDERSLLSLRTRQHSEQWV